MDNVERAKQIVKSINDAKANDNADMLRDLRAQLVDLNIKIEADGFAPITETEES